MKTVLLSGGCGLLGSEFAKTLKDNYEVIVSDLPNKIEESYKDSKNFKGYVPAFKGFKLDTTDENEVKEFFKYIGKIDILINVAAINPVPDVSSNEFENYSLEKWKKTLDVNLTGAFLLSRECIKYMLKNKNKRGFKGTVINISSDLGVITSDQSVYSDGYIKPPDYGVSKAGLIHLTKYIAGYYRNKIKAVCLSPGSVYNGQSDSLKQNLEKRIPIGRLAKKEEYNGAIKFLCSSDSDYMQGNNIIMDGGRNIW